MSRARNLDVAERGVSMVAGVAMALGVLAGCGSADAESSADEPSAQRTAFRAANPNPALFDKGSRPFGSSMETWAERWWGWVMATPFAGNPNLDATADCRANQSGPMFFLPHLLVGSATSRNCVVPRHKAVAISVATAFNDYPCPDPTFQPAPGQSLFDFLMGFPRDAQDNIANIESSLDGQPLDDMLSYRVASDDVFTFTGDTSMQQLDNCITGSPQQGVVDSFFIVLKPLERGTHVFTTRTVTKTGQVFGPKSITMVVPGDE